MKILTIGGATQDIFINSQEANRFSITQKEVTQTYMFFPLGTKIEIDHIKYKTGGGSTNSAVSFKRLGFDVSCFCKIGDDQAGIAILKTLHHEGVNTDFIIQSKEQSSAQSFIINSPHGEHTLLVDRGACAYLTKEDILEHTISLFDHLYITSLSNESAKVLPDIISFAQKHTIPVAINPGSSQLTTGAQQLKASLGSIDILILNSLEAKTFMLALVQADKTFHQLFKENKSCHPYNGSTLENQPYLIENLISYENAYFSMRNFFKEVLQSGTKIIVVTDGAHGVYVAHENYIYFHPSIKINPINTVGAGDAFGSCFVASLLKGYSLEHALRCGILNAASVLTKIGAKEGLLTFDALEKKIKTLDHSLLQKIPLS